VRIGLVCNPVAGGGKAGRQIEAVRALLEEEGCEVVEAITERAADAIGIVRGLVATVERVVVMGGDGTVNEVANALAWSGVPMAVIPVGTINVLALELDIPFRLEEAVGVAIRGAVRSLDLGKVGDRYFVLMAGAGLDALTIRELSPEAKRRYSELAFVWTGLRAYIRHPLPDFTVIIDGEEQVANFAVIGNSHYYGGRFGVTNHADPADGLLDVLTYAGRGFPNVAAFWAGLPLGLQEHHPDVRYARGEVVELVPMGADDVVWVQADGEIIGRLPVRAEIQSSALRVVVKN
jgi:YegS/Rv2252/BmrU family lipid kinase